MRETDRKKGFIYVNFEHESERERETKIETDREPDTEREINEQTDRNGRTYSDLTDELTFSCKNCSI